LELEEWKTRCPILRLTSHLTEDGSLSDDARKQLAADVAKTIDGAIAFADAALWPEPREALTDVV
jgi:TPP-dependent pyruvate/acetoin dehydrogenase alpha subunit